MLNELQDILDGQGLQMNGHQSQLHQLNLTLIISLGVNLILTY